MYDKIFEKAIQYVLGVEKGYVNDIDDAGGPTNFGVIQDTYNF